MVYVACIPRSTQTSRWQRESDTEQQSLPSAAALHPPLACAAEANRGQRRSSDEAGVFDMLADARLPTYGLLLESAWGSCRRELSSSPRLAAPS